MTATHRVTSRSRRAESLPADERRSMIVAATLPLLLEHGEMVTSRQIAAAAGIAEGTIFRVFADKDELIAAVIERAVDPAAIEQALAAIDGGAPLEVVVTAAVRLLQQRALDIARLMASVGPRLHPRGSVTDRPALIALLEAHRDRLAVDATDAARWLAAMTLAMSHPMISVETAPPEAIAALFLHGVSDEDRRC